MTLPFYGQVPFVSLPELVLFPHAQVAIKVQKGRDLKAFQKAWEGERKVAIFFSESSAKREEITSVGVLADIVRMHVDEEGAATLMLHVLKCVRNLKPQAGMLELHTTVEDVVDATEIDQSTQEVLLQSLKTLSQKCMELMHISSEFIKAQNRLTENTLDAHVWVSAENMMLGRSEKLQILLEKSLKNRALLTLKFLKKIEEKLTLESEIQNTVKQKLGKMQREIMLREQLDAIRSELGELGEDAQSEDKAVRLSERIEKLGLPKDSLKVVLDAAKKLESTPQNSPEHGMLKTWLDTLLAMPWQIRTGHEASREEAQRVLDQEHYGLSDIKKRILQHLSVMKLKGSNKGNILLFVGPPGVGKTSLGQSIAKALGRKFVRVALGGIRDESEIRGHRRTYIGAMPGRIAEGFKRAGARDAVVVLDEIDKMGAGYGGDPSAALLEVLDPEQNSTFTDHYLDIPFDLSEAFFIATANHLDGIPLPLLDRCEVIELKSYTTLEKEHIAETHLLPKQESEHGIPQGTLELQDGVLRRIITHHTREAGVRQLQRQLAALCRAQADAVLALGAHGQKKISISLKDLRPLLGPEVYEPELLHNRVTPGVVTGLAWTPVGGEILFVEATAVPGGSGHLILTGKLGDVMKESAQIALSLVKGLPQSWAHGFSFEKKDIHIHLPSGAIPKDGPSAGVAMVATLASLVSRTPISPRLAMTGEVTLRGNVTPVGGILEKVLAAHRAGVDTVILPRRNAAQWEEVPQEVRDALTVHFVDTVEEVLEWALGWKREEPVLGLGASQGANAVRL